MIFSLEKKIFLALKHRKPSIAIIIPNNYVGVRFLVKERVKFPLGAFFWRNKTSLSACIYELSSNITIPNCLRKSSPKYSEDSLAFPPIFPFLPSSKFLSLFMQGSLLRPIVSKEKVYGMDFSTLEPSVYSLSLSLLRFVSPF